MKKLIVLSSILFAIGCSKPDEVKPKDCNCNKVINVMSFNLPDGTKFGKYTTKNECTDFQQTFDWRGTAPKLNECK